MRSRSPVRPLQLAAYIAPQRNGTSRGARAKSRVVYAGLGADWQESAGPDNSPAITQFQAGMFTFRRTFHPVPQFSSTKVCRARIVSTLGHGQIYCSPITAPSRHPSVTQGPVAPPAVVKGVFMVGSRPSNRSGASRRTPSGVRPRSCPTAKSAKSCCAWRASWRPHPTSTNGYRRRDCRHLSKGNGRLPSLHCRARRTFQRL